MSFEYLHWAWKLDLGSAQKFLMVALADFADEEGSCFPGHARLAKMTGLSVPTVGRHIRALEDMGAFTRSRRPAKNGSGRTSDRYFLKLGWSPGGETVDEPVDNSNLSDCNIKTDEDFNLSTAHENSGFNLSNAHDSTYHPDRGTLREPPELINPQREASEPCGSDTLIEAEVVDEEVETQTRLLDALDDAVEENGFKRPGRTKANQRAMRLLLTKDGYTETQVSWMIGWATDHHFWYKNIRSAEKLRQQFDRLVVEAKENAGGGPRGGVKLNSAEQRGADHADVIAQMQARELAEQGNTALAVEQ